MKELFSKDKINANRQLELDIAKSFSTIFMIFIHTITIAMLFENTISDPYYVIVGSILGGPFSAPVFMFCMGIGIIYSRRSQPNSMIKRGIKLFLLGLLVNIFSFIIPHLLLQSLFNSGKLIPIFGGLILFYVDILEFAGLSFVLLGIFKKMKLSNKQILAVGIVLSFIGFIFRFSDFGSIALNILFGYFIGTFYKFTAFPLFSWIIFPIAGYIYGHYFIRLKDKSKFFRLWPIFIIASIIYFFVYLILIYDAYGTFPEGYYFYMSPLLALFCIILVHGDIGFSFWLSKRIPEKLKNIFTLFSKNITGIYVVQWLLIPITIILIKYVSKSIVFNDLYVTLIALFIVIASTLCALSFKRIKVQLNGK